MLRNHLRLFAAILLLALALAGGWLWRRGYWNYDIFAWTSYHGPESGSYQNYTQWVVIGNGGSLYFFRVAAVDEPTRFDGEPVPTWLWLTHKNVWVPRDTFWRKLGFYWGESGYDFPAETPMIGLPLWLIELFLLAVSVYLFTQWRKHRRHPKGHCQRCGYDLRETPERCPECGTPVGATPASPAAL